MCPLIHNKKHSFEVTVYITNILFRFLLSDFTFLYFVHWIPFIVGSCVVSDRELCSKMIVFHKCCFSLITIFLFYCNSLISTLPVDHLEYKKKKKHPSKDFHVEGSFLYFFHQWMQRFGTQAVTGKLCQTFPPPKLMPLPKVRYHFKRNELICELHNLFAISKMKY